jgi:L-iditol 2-dehydrogenase
MAEPLAAALHALARATDATDAGVLGGGPMGLMLAALLIGQGRSTTVADPHAERRAQARELGAHTAERLQRRHELVFEAVGRPEAWREAVEAARPGGVVVLVGGCPRGSVVTLPPGPIHYDELELRGAFHHGPDEVDEALAALARGDVDWQLLAGETIPLDELSRALASPPGGRARKWVVDPSA